MIGGKLLDVLLEPGSVKNTSSRDGMTKLVESALGTSERSAVLNLS
jgi:hypothetical protein